MQITSQFIQFFRESQPAAHKKRPAGKASPSKGEAVSRRLTAAGAFRGLPAEPGGGSPNESFPLDGNPLRFSPRSDTMGQV